MPPILNQIDNSLVGYTPGQPEFVQLVADTLGNVGDASDGFDAEIAAIVVTFPQTDSMLDSMVNDAESLDSDLAALDAIDTDSWASGFPPIIAALSPMPQKVGVNLPGGISLPSLPPPPTGQPTQPPPQCCQPAPGPTPTPAPQPAPGPSPQPVPPPPTIQCPPGYGYNLMTQKCQPICPPGWTFTSDGQCQPPPVSPPSVPPAPPVVLPPMPPGLPPCPPGFTSTTGTDCNPADSSSTESNILMVLGDALLQLSGKELVPVTASWVAGFVGISASTSFLLVGALIGIAGLLISLLGGGCGAPCIESSKVEQVYEAIGDNILRVAKAGMLGGSAAIVAITHFMGVGNLALNRLGTAQAQAGEKNMDTVLTNLITAARRLPANATAPLDVAAAQKLYVGGAGWYPDSIAVASQVTTQFLTALAAPAPAAS